jgi:drug/metabolite transporter (DMT)-like permease
LNTEEFFKNNKGSIIISLICTILWGSAFPVLKITYSELNLLSNDYNSKVFLAALRFFLAGAMLFIFVKFFQKESLKIKSKDIYWILILGLLQTTFGYFFFYNGLANTTAMKGAILGTLENFLVVIFAHYIYKDDRINKNKIIGLLTGLIGVVVVNWGASFSLEFKFNGEGFMIISAICSAIATFLAKAKGKNINIFLMTAWQMCIGSLMMMVWGIPVINNGGLKFTTLSFVLLIYSSILSAIAFSLWYVLLKHHKVGDISLYKFMIPVSGAILSIIFIPGESLTFNIVIALVLVSLGIILINRRQKV